MTSPERPLLLPEGVRLVHIGPHKTGTTALQGAFDAARVSLARQGVLYAGHGLQPAEAAIAATGRKPLRGESYAGPQAWQRLVDEVRGAGRQRVMVSSEFLAAADPATVRRVVEDLGGDDVHVLVTLRALWRMVPSQWQQSVQNGQRTAFGRWLDRLLNHPERPPAPRFWHRHRHGELVARWAEAVGPDRVTVIAVDEQDRTMLMRTVEELLGLWPGTLHPVEDRTNRSLTWPEAELVRRVNRRSAAWSDETYANLVRHGAVRTMKLHPPATGTPIRLPGWAREPLAREAREAVRAIRACGARTVGDLDTLAEPPPATRDDGAAEAGGAGEGGRVDAATAAYAVLGVVGATGVAGADKVSGSSSRRLAAALAARGRERASVRLSRLRRAVTGRGRR